jgi:hypothetical protein
MVSLDDTGFGNLLRDYESYGKVLEDSKWNFDGVFLNVGTYFYPLKDFLQKYDYVAISDEMIAVANDYSLSTNSDQELIEKEDWSYLERLFIKRCTMKNVTVVVEQELAQLRVAGKEEAQSQRQKVIDAFVNVLDDYINEL